MSQRAFVHLPYERPRVERAMAKVRETVKDARILMRGNQVWMTGTIPTGITSSELANMLRLAGIDALQIVMSTNGAKAG